MRTLKDLLHNRSTSSFLGYSIQQSWADLATWDQFFNRYKISSLIELGTGYCGMSMYLLLQCIQKEIKFLTFDIKANSRLHHPLSKRLALVAHFMEMDIFAEKDFVEDVISRVPKPLLLFCDNGDKPREFKEFVPCLEKDDYIAVHDWPSEISKKDVEGYSIRSVMEAECVAWKSYTRFWRIV